MKNGELGRLKAALTRAINSGDPEKVIKAVSKAYRRFDETYWPDCWSEWDRAKRDAFIKWNRTL